MTGSNGRDSTVARRAERWVGWLLRQSLHERQIAKALIDQLSVNRCGLRLLSRFGCSKSARRMPQLRCASTVAPDRAGKKEILAMEVEKRRSLNLYKKSMINEAELDRDCERLDTAIKAARRHLNLLIPICSTISPEALAQTIAPFDRWGVGERRHHAR